MNIKKLAADIFALSTELKTVSKIVGGIEKLKEIAKAEDELPEDVRDTLLNYYMDSGEMPYGTAKARTGDPDVWVLDRLQTLIK